jgi:hypothetical protein
MGESFRSLGLAQKVEVCKRVINKHVMFKYTDPEGLERAFHGIFWWFFFEFAESNQRGVLLLK